LAVVTTGQTRGHSSAAGALSVAAVSAAVARGGAFIGGNTNPVETFSSDGPRRIFFSPEGTALVPNNFLFATNGGTLREKPDIAAADGVSTSVPGFTSFFGTSAAAPHAAAIAALLKSAAPSLTSNQIRELMTATALDIGPLGWDRTAGIGIVTALGSYLSFAPAPLLEFQSAQISPLEGDGDRFIEPGESARIDLIFFNSGNLAATDVKVKLASATPGVTVLSNESDYFPIAAGKAGVNLSPLSIRLAESVPCGARLNFTATISSQGQNPRTIPFSLLTGQPGSTAQTFAYTGAPVPIPDGNTVGVAIRVPISGLATAISKVSFRINGDNCASPSGVGLQHAWVGDLTLRLISPNGTVVTLMSAPGGTNNFGENFCQTLLDDSGLTSIQNISTAGTYSGTFRPATPLAAFIGQNGNGNWTLQVIDSSTPDAGIMRSFSILITTFDCQKAPAVQEVRVNTNSGGAQARRSMSVQR
jgi:subtilisin-like proprotein convertase family protein